MTCLLARCAGLVYGASMKKLSTLCAALAVFLISLTAHATFGYVCYVNQYNFSGFGSYGGILINFYTGPNCTGSMQFVGYACTTGSTTNVCSSSSFNTYSEAQLMNLFDSLTESGRAGTRINYVISAAACRAGGTNCLESMNFYSN